MTKPSEPAEVEISGRIERGEGVAVYRGAEYSLVYKPILSLPKLNARRSSSGAWRQSGQRAYLRCGFVTLVFDGMPLAFTELDAYANRAKWTARNIALPISQGSGALVLIDQRLDDDRISIDVEPRFEIDRQGATIRIGFAQDGESYFDVGSGLFAGIRDRRLTSMILSTVQFE